MVHLSFTASLFSSGYSDLLETFADREDDLSSVAEACSEGHLLGILGHSAMLLVGSQLVLLEASAKLVNFKQRRNQLV